MRTALLLLTLLASGCGYKVQAKGMIRPNAERVTLESMAGDKVPLKLARGNANLLQYLDGYMVEISGIYRRKELDVYGWSVLQGAHGLMVWMGEIVGSAGEYALRDPQNNVTMPLAGGDLDELERYRGQLVVVEGVENQSERAFEVYHILPLFD